MTITATYSPEDNKLRIDAPERFDAETLELVKKHGFRWAPQQKLWIAPRWTPAREDVCLKLAGEIFAEQTTMAERAEMKAERLEGLAERRASEATSYSNAARDMAASFAGGQPILAGHHSERKATKAQERAENMQKKAVNAANSVHYWNYRADGVLRHADRKNTPKVRANRIKTLLKELREHQREFNGAHKILNDWLTVTDPAKIEKYALGLYSYQGGARDCDKEAFKAGTLSAEDMRTNIITRWEAATTHEGRRRCIVHILNRLDYERALLGPVARFDGTLTPAILQTFARTMGADKPKATATDYGFTLASPVALPYHVGEGMEIEKTNDEWCEFMHGCGYEVPAKKAVKPPILNLPTDVELSYVNQYSRGTEPETVARVEMTKAEYAKVYKEQRGTRLSTCGTFRFKTCPAQKGEGPSYKWGWVAPFITDSKQHDTPESMQVQESVAA